ncbi:Response regulator receiver domain protein [Leptospira kirschneri serovar Mozdok]|nr:Response regulator receiver domain protein [Leptospira kirschneri serovar Mozdok]
MRTILLTEDEPGIRDTIQIVLESEGFKMIYAMTGKECISFLKESPDLLVLDVGLPDASGFEILKELRKKKFYSSHFTYRQRIGTRPGSWFRIRRRRLYGKTV